ncbi:S1/P1 nuclease [Salinispirillum marinum]|uniref:S1/P1 nuclease n=2 Tax=Saccharospirillaceae TaxID=255527 RepID=A0ABV8BEM9_9GAMM
MIIGLLLSAGASVQAFDARGHEVVVQLASRFFSADTEALLRNYYGSNYRLALINDANAVAITNQLPENTARLALHYTWFDDDDTQFDPAKHCPQAMCSVGAVLAAERALITPSLPRAQRMEALRALMHYMGDLHDPMNAGYRTDSSGRDIMLMGPDLRRVSLYAIWQSLLFDYLRGRPFEIANAWGRELTEQQVNEWSQGNPQAWIWETHEVARNTAYATVGAADGWNAVYRVAVLPTFEEQIQRAAVRLAQRLNAVSAELAAQGAL